MWPRIPKLQQIGQNRSDLLQFFATFCCQCETAFSNFISGEIAHLNSLSPHMFYGPLIKIRNPPKPRWHRSLPIKLLQPYLPSLFPVWPLSVRRGPGGHRKQQHSIIIISTILSIACTHTQWERPNLINVSQSQKRSRPTFRCGHHQEFLVNYRSGVREIEGKFAASCSFTATCSCV